MKKVLIVGGGGYVGTKLTKTLLDRGYDVTVIDLFWFGNHLDERASVVNKDIFDLTESDLSNIDVVVFTAGLSNDPMAEFSPSENFISNASAPSYLAYIAKRAGVARMIYASSCSVYGYTVEEMYDETGPTEAQYPYGLSKLQGERSVVEMADDNFSVIAFRKGTVSGYSPRMRLDLVVNAMFKNAMQNNKITVNNPAIWRPILAIDDCISAYVRAIESDKSLSGVFNIASGNYTIGEIGDIVCEMVSAAKGVQVELEIKDIKDMRNYKALWNKAETIIGLKPKRKVEDIVKQLIEENDKFVDYDNDDYYNIKVFRKMTEGS